MVDIVNQNYTENKIKYKKLERKLRKVLGNSVLIHHVGSTAIPRMYGKNIIDILIGVDNHNELNRISDELIYMNYYPSINSDEKEYRFFASRKEETIAGDIHIHVAIRTTDRYRNFLVLKTYLLNNREETKKYCEYKKYIINNITNNRKEYKENKSQYVNELLNRAIKYSDSLFPSEIVIVRHGENIYDDSITNNLLPLSKNGIEQAKWAREVLNDNFDVVFASTSRRTIQTAQIIVKSNNIKTDERLLERGWGYPKYDGTETDEDAGVRFKSFYKEIMENYRGMRVLIVTHGSLIKIIQNIIENMVKERGSIENCHIIKYSADLNDTICTFKQKSTIKPYDKEFYIEYM